MNFIEQKYIGVTCRYERCMESIVIGYNTLKVKQDMHSRELGKCNAYVRTFSVQDIDIQQVKIERQF